MCNVIVDGPVSVIDTEYYWVYKQVSDRQIPSDLYYSHATRTSEAPEGERRHDFDYNNNGLYGQYKPGAWPEESVDGVAGMVRVRVGRAPVASGDDARAFVDKVLTYERLESPDGVAVDRDYLRRVVLSAGIHADPWETTDPGYRIFQKRNENPVQPPAFPPEGTFDWQPFTLQACLQQALADKLRAGGIWSNPHVVVRFQDEYDPLCTDVEIQSFYCGQAAGGPGNWSFVDPNGQATPAPTEHVSFFGTALVNQPLRIYWYPSPPASERDLDNRASEEVYVVLTDHFASFTEVRRIYTDFFGYDGVERLTTPAVRDALDAGCHFASLCGHGGTQGCIPIWWHEFGPPSTDRWATPDFKNDKRHYILFAHSCITACPDDAGETPRLLSLGEKMVLDPNGGAVAYVGNVRVSYFGREEELFWTQLADYPFRLGAGMVGDLNSADHGKYDVYLLMLYGDPEVPIWTDLPESYQVIYPATVKPGQTLTIFVMRDDQPLTEQQVTFMGGYITSRTIPAMYETVETSAPGSASYLVPAGTSEKALTVTVTPIIKPSKRQNFKPFIVEIPIVA